LTASTKSIRQVRAKRYSGMKGQCLTYPSYRSQI
jgi:hypothetical protein